MKNLQQPNWYQYVHAGIVITWTQRQRHGKREVYKYNCNPIVTSHDNTAMYIPILTNFEDSNPSLSNEVHRLISVETSSLPAIDTCTANSFHFYNNLSTWNLIIFRYNWCQMNRIPKSLSSDVKYSTILKVNSIYRRFGTK